MANPLQIPLDGYERPNSTIPPAGAQPSSGNLQARPNFTMPKGGATAMGVSDAEFRNARPIGGDPQTIKPVTAPTSNVTTVGGLKAQQGIAGKAGYLAGRAGALANSPGGRVVGKLAGAAGVVSNFNDYKLDDPEVDSSATGTFNALKQGDFAGAGRSLGKGAIEAGMDLGSFAANTADVFVPGQPFSQGYNRLLKSQFGDQLVDRTQPKAPAGPTKGATTPLPFGAPDPNQRVARNLPGASGESLKGAYGAYSPAGTFDKSYTDLGGGIAGKGSGSRGQFNDFTNIGANGQPTAMSQGDSRTPDQIANAARINADTARFVAQRDQERQGDPYQNALRAAAGQIGIPLDQMTPRTMAAAVQMANAQTQAQVQGQGNRLQHDAAMFGHNISAANNRATVSATMYKAQRDQLNADRTHELAQSTHDLAQQKAGDDRVGEAAKKYAAGPDGKVDPDKERAYLNSTDALLGNAIKAATDRGDHKLAEQLTRQGRAGVDSQIAQQHTARLKSAQIASGAHGWTPWSGTHIKSDDPTDYDIVGEDKGLLWNTTRLKGGSSVPSWNYKGGLNPFAAGTTEFDSIGGHKLRQAQ